MFHWSNIKAGRLYASQIFQNCVADKQIMRRILKIRLLNDYFALCFVVFELCNSIVFRHNFRRIS